MQSNVLAYGMAVRFVTFPPTIQYQSQCSLSCCSAYSKRRLGVEPGNEASPHFRGCCVRTLMAEDAYVRMMSSFERVLCTGFNEVVLI